MKTRGLTLVELMAALALTAVVAGIAGALLFRSLDLVERDADSSAAARDADTALDDLAADLAAQTDARDYPAPVVDFSLTKENRVLALYIAAPEGVRSVAWYLAGEGAFDLFRVEAGASATAAALPGNAAGNAARAILAGTLKTGDSGAVHECPRVTLLHRDAAPSGAIPQILMESLTAEGARRLAAGEAITNLPVRCVLSSARPVPAR
jgi:prepilin-type N-terminal cleavage/methylation domain-containing protein